MFWCPPSIHTAGLVNTVIHLTSYPETIEEEGSEVGSPYEEDAVDPVDPVGKAPECRLESPTCRGKEQLPAEGASPEPSAPRAEEKDAAETRKRRRLEEAGIRVRPAAQRFARLALSAKAGPAGFVHAQSVELVWQVDVSILFSHFLLFPLHHHSWLQANKD